MGNSLAFLSDGRILFCANQLGIFDRTVQLFKKNYLSLSVIVVAFAEYTSAPFYPGCAAPELLKKFLAITALLFISIVNGLSVKVSLSSITLGSSSWSSILKSHLGLRKNANNLYNSKIVFGNRNHHWWFDHDRTRGNTKFRKCFWWNKHISFRLGYCNL